MMIAGLEKHDELQGYVEQIKIGINSRSIVNTAIHIRLSAEYITAQYIQEYPLCVGEDLNNNIDNLLKNEIIDEEDASLLHTMRIKGNKYGAHRKNVVIDKEAVLAELIELADRFYEYLPFFLKKFPIPSEKPEPKAGILPKLGFEIDFESIQPLELHSNWRNCIGYNDMLRFREIPEFKEYIEWIYRDYNDTEIFFWFWCVMLTDRLNLVIRNGEKEYLDIKKLAKYYYDALQKNSFDEWMQLPNGYEATYYIPAIIREYFPNDLACFVKGKGYEWTKYETDWGESGEKRQNETVAALVNGETANVKQCLANEIHWYTIGRALEEEKERQIAEAQAKKWQEERRAEEAARIEKDKKDYAERKARREKEVAEARKQQIKKGAKGFGILYLIVIVLCLLMFIFNKLGGAKLAVDLIIIVVVAYFVIKRKRKDE